eukprot:8964173-Ditylum_brightwellii.AAC.1
MAINASLIDTITKSFLHPVLPSVVGQLTYEAIYEIHKLIMENASAIPSTVGGGNQGHLGLVIEAP